MTPDSTYRIDGRIVASQLPDYLSGPDVPDKDLLVSAAGRKPGQEGDMGGVWG